MSKTKDEMKQEAIDTAFEIWGSSAGAYDYLFEAGYSAAKSEEKDDQTES